MIEKKDMALSLAQRLLLLLCLFLVCYILTAAASYLLGRLLVGRPAAALRISAMLQDVLTFIVPAVITAVMVTRRPAELLCLRGKASGPAWLLMFAMLMVSVPAMDAIIYWNAHIPLPESFAAVARAMEDQAAGLMRVMLADDSIASLAVNILVVGIAAGFSEEILFRGCFQRLLTTGGVNRHVAIWTVAFVFSALHMQVYGFVPRMLLGAYFGYLLLWSGSLWLPIAAHVLNNTVYVVTAWWQVRQHSADVLTAEPMLWNWIITAASAILAAATLYGLYKCRIGNRE